jgi:hypothetical protein
MMWRNQHLCGYISITLSLCARISIRIRLRIRMLKRVLNPLQMYRSTRVDTTQTNELQISQDERKWRTRVLCAREKGAAAAAMRYRGAASKREESNHAIDATS